MTKQEKIDMLQQELDALRTELRELKDASDEEFKSSRLYRRMADKIHGLELMEKVGEAHIENEITYDRKLLARMKDLEKDNTALCRKHDTAYWAGMAGSHVRAKELRELKEKVTELEAKVAAKDVIINHLKGLLCNIEPEEPRASVKGRPPIPDEQKKRIRSYRRKGYTIKAISELEGVSAGAVYNICKAK